MRLAALARWIDETLDIDAFGADSSLNGLQVEGRKTVKRVATAVDACEETITRAARARIDLLIVHHGLFWGPAVPITGFMARRLRRLLSNGISLYAAHLPLDCHPELGNNARLADLLGVEDRDRFGRYKGIDIGVRGALPRPVATASLAARVRRVTGAPVRTFPFGPSRIKRLGIVSGGGSMLLQAAAEAGCDALLTGEPAHSAWHVAREARINLLCGGHYATETLGVRTLGERVAGEFGLPVSFIDVPTGL